jgi:hypothetical protein
MDINCRAKGAYCPEVAYIKSWTLWLLDFHGSFEEDPKMLIRAYITYHWDEGAFRTFYSYCYGYDMFAAEVLYDYYKQFYNKAEQRWCCHNPSAAAVWLIRLCYVTLSADEKSNFFC